MSLYGYQRKTTPNLERIAEECTIYTRCFAPSCWTIPSHASIFTGLYPSQHRAHEGNPYLSENVQHLVPVLQKAGYHTFGISSNGLVSPALGLCRGFDYFKDFGKRAVDRFVGRQIKPIATFDELWTRISLGGTLKNKMKIFSNYVLENNSLEEIVKEISSVIINRIDKAARPTPFTKSSTFTEETVNIFQSFIERYKAKNHQPFLLFINFIEPHMYYRPPLKWRQFSRWYDKQLFGYGTFYRQIDSSNKNALLERYRNLHDDEIYYLDNIINRMWNIFKLSPLSNETVFIITSDHGEHFGEKGIYGHALSLYNELIWVPLIIRFPRTFDMKGLDHRLVSLNDLYSTILDIAHNPIPRPETSVSLLSSYKRDLALAQIVYPEYWRGLMEAKQEVCRLKGSIFSPPIMAALTAKGKKIIEMHNGSLEVYDLVKDMSETEDMAPTMSPEVINNLRKMMEFLKIDTGYLEAVAEAGMP